MLRLISAAAFALLLTLLHSLPAAASQQSLEDIRFESISPNEERIIFRLTSSEMPKFFPIRGDGKPRLVFDFSDTAVSKRIKNSVEINGKLVERVRVGIHENKTRVVFDLVEGRHVQTIQEPDQDRHLLTVIVHDAGVKPSLRQTPPAVSSTKPPVLEKTEPQQSVRPSAAVKIEPPQEENATQTQSSSPAASFNNGSSTVLSTVLFDKNSNRGEMVMFRLNKFHPPVVFGLEENKPRVVCDFQDTVAGERLADNIPAGGKFVRSIRIDNSAAEHKIRVVLDLMPNRSYDLQQVFFKNDNLFVLIINTLGSSAKQLN